MRSRLLTTAWWASLLALCLLSVPPARPLAAQSGVIWSEPKLLSDREVDSWPPTMVADAAGNVHVVWSQTMSRDSRLVGEGDSLFYRRWDGKEWSRPVNILVSPEGGAEWPQLAITPDNMLHLIWGTGSRDSRLYYSQCACRSRA